MSHLLENKSTMHSGLGGKIPHPMPRLLENKSTMHSDLGEPFLLLHMAVGVGLMWLMEVPLQWLNF
jgi:hypothetical protein